MTRPAVIGGDPLFPGGLPFARPSAPPLDRVVARLRPSYERGVLTNGPLVAAFEAAVEERLQVPHAIAVSNCTSGLLLVLRVLELSGSAVLPSFTFSATAHAAAWNGLEPVFAECDPDTFQVDLADARDCLPASDDAAVLVATHVFGAPAPAVEAEAVATAAGVPLVFDAAHALGALRQGRPVGGFGIAEVFSLSPTKPVVAGEGGVITTRDSQLAERLRWGRDYGNPGDYDTRFPGLNARMSELHAAVAIESLAELDANLALRNQLAARYRSALTSVDGVAVQAVADGDLSTYKDFTIAVDEGALGLSRDLLVTVLEREGIDTRRYFWPPVHRHQAYARTPRRDLPVTDAAAGSVVSLPLFTGMIPDDTDRVAEGIARASAHAEEVAAKVRRAAPAPR